MGEALAALVVRAAERERKGAEIGLAGERATLEGVLGGPVPLPVRLKMGGRLAQAPLIVGIGRFGRQGFECRPPDEPPQGAEEDGRGLILAGLIMGGVGEYEALPGGGKRGEEEQILLAVAGLGGGKGGYGKGEW